MNIRRKLSYPVSVWKRSFWAISALICGIPRAAYQKYASAQSLDFLDLAKKSSFLTRKLTRIYPEFPDGHCLLVCCGVLMVILMTGCGKKGPPFFASRVQKSAIEEIEVSLRRGGVLISWRETVGYPGFGEETGAGKYLISRWDADGPEKQIATIQQSGRSGRWYQYLDLAVIAESEYRYVIQLVSSGGGILFRSREMIARTGREQYRPGPVAIIGGDRRATLSWDPMLIADGEGKELLGYNIFRRQNGNSYNLMQPLTPMPVRERFFLDAGLENSSKYCYALSAVLSGEAGMEESGLSMESCAILQDTSPPAPPSGVHAEAGADHILVAWRKNREGDLAGYRIYRRQGVEAAFILLTTDVLFSPSYRDEDVDTGQEYYYAVTAIDTSPSANESPYSGIVRAVFEP